MKNLIKILNWKNEIGHVTFAKNLTEASKGNEE